MRLRRLADIADSGQARWFAPALDLLHSLPDEGDERVRDLVSRRAPVFVARAPGRLDVLGGIADYSGGLVLEMPLDRATFVILQRQPDARIDVASRRNGRWHFCSVDMELVVSMESPAALAAWFATREADRWAAYVIGVVHAILHHPAAAGELRSGFQLVIDSSVPEGKGVSSSAALEVATMAAVNAACGIDMSLTALAAACQAVENHVVGAPCGIMDQMTSVYGRRERLLRLRCQPSTIEGYCRVPRGYRFYGIDSGVRHAVTGADYVEVRAAAFMGYRMIAEMAGLPVDRTASRVTVDDPIWGGYLTNIELEDFSRRFASRLPDRVGGGEFLARYGGITDTATRVDPTRHYAVRSATEHPIAERDRVERFASLLELRSPTRETAIALGQLMYVSHASYSACGLGSEGTDRLVEHVAAAGPGHGLFGAKITGGGSGGTVAILGTDDARDLVYDLAATYSIETGRRTEVFDGSSPGAGLTGVLLVTPDER